MNRLSKVLLAAAAVLLTALSVRAADADQPTQAMFKTLMNATVADDYDGFVAVCDDRMKAAMTKAELDMVSHSIAASAKDGYDAQYFGELQQHGFAVHIWRVRFKAGGDDILATLSIKDGKVGGFYLH